jgi:hypothetical protein
MPRVILTSYDTGFNYDASIDASADYDAWTDHVCAGIDAQCGFEVEVEIEPFGRGFGDRYEGTDDEVETMREAMRALWDSFLDLPHIPLPATGTSSDR